MERRSSNTKRARHRSGTVLDIPLVPPGGFENSPRGEIGDAGVDGPNPAFRPEEPGTVAVPGSIFLWCPVCKNTRTMMTVVNGAVYLRFSRAA